MPEDNTETPSESSRRRGEKPLDTRRAKSIPRGFDSLLCSRLVARTAGSLTMLPASDGSGHYRPSLGIDSRYHPVER